MADELKSPLLKPTDAAYQVVIELIRSGAFVGEPIDGSKKADAIIKVFDKLELRFKKIKSEKS
ncbi:hypothetical protein Xish_00307 [Xenorhabdus ishibashii]|uniref:Uncharacterized protein n=2 Tax=Xenorhabdus ishibashii TaxID=1034471 RepID=A0A2D0KCZ4_9GAMM|nr:hypothetical protein Xish_00307 [Xenorhabdus ishibashii]